MEVSVMDDEQQRPAVPGDTVGLGRVVDNPANLGKPERETDPGALVEAASEDSFPASDPPTFADSPATPADGAERMDAPGDADAPADLPGTELPDREDPV
jgi:hypothetical protein